MTYQLSQQQRNDLSSQLFDVIRDALLIYDQRGKIIEVNKAACQLYQYSYDEIIGLHGYELIAESNHHLFDEFINTVSKGESFTTQSQDVKKDGGIFETDIKGLPFIFQEKRLLLAIVRDVTDKNQALRSKEDTFRKYQRLLQNIPDVIWTTDNKGNTLFITENVFDLIGFTQDEIYQDGNAWFNNIHPEDLDLVQESFNGLFTKNTPFNVEYRIKTKRGEWIWVNDRSTNVHTEDGRLVADGVITDITDRKKIEIELTKSEKRFKSLFENAPDAYYLNDFNGRFIDGNKHAEKLLGYSKEELINKKLTELSLLPKRYIPKAIKNMLAAKNGKPTGPDEFELHRKDGSKIIAEINTIPVTLNGKKMVLGVAHDVTAWKQAQTRLREAKETFETMFNTMADPVMILDKKGKFLELTDKVKEYTGFEKEEILGQNFLKTKLLTPKSKAICIKNLLKRMAGVDVKPYEVEALTKDGRKIPFEVNAQRITYKEEPADLVVFRDITNRKETEEKLRQSEKIYRNLFQNAQVGLFRTSVENGNILDCNNQIAKMFGFKSRNDFIKKYNLETFYVHSEDRKELVELLKENGQVNHFEAAFYRKDKSIFWARYSAKLDEENNWIEGVFEDITEIKKAEEKLKKKHEQLKSEQKQLLSIFDSINHAIYVADPKSYEILYMNSKLRDALQKEVDGKKCYEVLQNKNKPCEFCTNDIILKNRGEPYKWEYHNPILEKDYELTDKIITWPDGREVRMELAVDITDRKKALEEIKKAHETVKMFNKQLEQKVQEKTDHIEKLLKQKDEFINQLGHDLKNPLGPLINLLPIVAKHSTDSKDKEMLAVVQRNVKYMKNLVQKTLELARLNSPNTILSKKSLHLKTRIEENVQRNKYLFEEKNITVNVDVSDEMIIYADMIRLEELFTNLLHNAVKYNQEKGSILIKASDTQDKITISFKDDGIGMTKNQLQHIFDEFYKADESRHDFESSGLGMAICKRIIEKHGGKIWAESEGLGKGSTFYISFPKQDQNFDAPMKHPAKKKSTSFDEISSSVDNLIENRYG